jgi:RNA polymerase sigma-70 factor (ECF subfamily)
MKDEPALLKSARRLEKEALTAIFDTYAPVLYKYVLRICHDPIESDSIVGDVFAELLELLAAGRGPWINLKAYLFKLAYHSIADGARHNHRIAALETVTGTSNRRRKESVHAQIEERDLLESFRGILNNELKEIERHVIILRFMEDFSLQETADIVGKKVNHVKVIQNRGVAKLRKSLENQSWTIRMPKTSFAPRNSD